MGEFYHDGRTIPDAPPKDPDSTIDYGIDWALWLDEGEAIQNSEWLVHPDLTVVSSEFSQTLTKVFLSGGVVNGKYQITNRITTQFRTEDRSMMVKCSDK